MELLPRFKPSTIPAAIASTFFNAPAISTPVTSLYHQELQTVDTHPIQSVFNVTFDFSDAKRGIKAVGNTRILEAIDYRR